MLLTEEQAKQKWCSESREICDKGASGNRDYQGKPMSMCLGSGCTKWRWFDRPGDVRFSAPDGTGPGPEWIDAGVKEGSLPGIQVRRWRRPIPNRRGFCGLAGLPADFDE